MVDTTVNGGRRARRSTRVSEQLEHARRRNITQLAEMRSREQQVEQALRAYVVVTEKISDAERDGEEKVARLQRRIAEMRESTVEAVAALRRDQAQAVLAMHRAGRTVPQVAELLDLSQKAARQFVSAGRTASVNGSGHRHDASAAPVAVTGRRRPADGPVRPPEPSSGSQSDRTQRDAEQAQPGNLPVTSGGVEP